MFEHHHASSSSSPARVNKVEDLGVDACAAALAATAGHSNVPKPRRRRANNASGHKGGIMPVAHSSVVSGGGSGFVKAGATRKSTGAAGSVSPLSGSSGDDRAGGGGSGSGISTRKQQEAATRPREKGRFVKRAPAVLPISAFKPPSDRHKAVEAAEAAEEARQKADEAATSSVV